MRRIAGLAVCGLGVLLIILAALVRFVVTGAISKAPLNEHAVAIEVAGGASYFSHASLMEVTGAVLHETLRLTGDRAAGSGSRAVWTQHSDIYDETSHRVVSSSTDRLAFNRRTGELINCCGISRAATSAAGKDVLGFVWPQGARQQPYDFFDATLGRPVLARFAGTAAVDGLRTYKYVVTVPVTRLGTKTVPGPLVGSAEARPLTVAEYDRSRTTYFVDPVTGQPVKQTSAQHLYLGNSTGTQLLNLLNAYFTTNPASVARFVRSARSKDAEIFIVSLIVPVVLALAGLIASAMGAILTLTGRREVASGTAHPSSRSQVP